MDWSKFKALTDEEVIARALADPDNKPRTDADFARMKRRPVPTSCAARCT